MAPALEKTASGDSPFRTFRVLVLLPLVFAYCSGCATRSQTPAWPEQPSPPYPVNSEVASQQDLDEEPVPTAKTAKSEPLSASRLAKQYDGSKALATLRGKATYYADSLAGNHTANGDVYDPAQFTAAHKKLAFGTIVRVIREDTGRTTYVRINDRGPFGSAERIIDVSKAAAKELDMLRAGVVGVRVEIVSRPSAK